MGLSSEDAARFCPGFPAPPNSPALLAFFVFRRKGHSLSRVSLVIVLGYQIVTFAQLEVSSLRAVCEPQPALSFRVLPLPLRISPCLDCSYLAAIGSFSLALPGCPFQQSVFSGSSRCFFSPLRVLGFLPNSSSLISVFADPLRVTVPLPMSANFPTRPLLLRPFPRPVVHTFLS